MSRYPDLFDGNSDADDARAFVHGERLSASTPLLELLRGEGHRWASLDVTDLDPPTPLPPCPAN
jgi:hypothetical protein